MIDMIKTHRELADFIAGKRVVLMNSLGKDSVLCLEWLSSFARPASIVSVTYQFFAEHPGDKPYIQYLKKRFPEVEFRFEPSPFDVTRICIGIFQTPLAKLLDYGPMEFDSFDPQKVTEDIRKELGADFVCYGLSRYESFDRANYFHRKGLVDDTFIYPLGMMSKAQVIELIRNTGIKLHPSYKLAKSTLDKPTYYKMRSAFIANPEYKKKVYSVFPLLALDEYRYEVLFK